MNIPFFDYPKLYQENSEEYLAILQKTLSKGSFIMQSELEEFEENLAKYLGCKHAIGVADGTVAITFSLKAAGLMPGDEVIVCSHTFIATAAAVVHAGGIPVVCDCMPDSTIDLTSAEKLLTNKTRFLLPTQLNGRVCDMAAVTDFCNTYSLTLVEDSCQSLGAMFDGEYAGLFGVAGSFSFFPAKTLGAFGDAGAVVTNNDSVASHIRLLRNHGRSEDSKVKFFGYNGRLDNIQAAILNTKLSSYTDYILKRRSLAAQYNQILSTCSAIRLPPQPNINDTKHFDIFQNYEVAVPRREELRQHLSSKGIGTLVQWGGWMLHQFDDLNFRSHAPYAEKLSREMLLLPMSHLLELDQVTYIATSILEFYS